MYDGTSSSGARRGAVCVAAPYDGTSSSGARRGAVCVAAPYDIIACFLTVAYSVKLNVFAKPRGEGISRSVCTIPRRENDCCEETSKLFSNFSNINIGVRVKI